MTFARSGTDIKYAVWMDSNARIHTNSMIPRLGLDYKRRTTREDKNRKKKENERNENVL